MGINQIVNNNISYALYQKQQGTKHLKQKLFCIFARVLIH